MTSESSDNRRDDIAHTGRIGFWVAIALAVLLGLHPPGSTELYGDGKAFLEHIDGFWIAIHVAVAVLLFVVPLVVGVWASHLATAKARVYGGLATSAAVGGAAIGVLHLVGMDTMTFVAFSDTFESGAGSEAVLVGADILLRIHAATLAAWALSFFFVLPVSAGIAAMADGRYPAWYWLLLLVAGVSALGGVIVAFSEGQWSDISETVLLRISGVLAIVWILITSWWMRKGSTTPVQ